MYRILILEDSPADAELVQYKLKRSGMEFLPRVVSSREDFIAALQSETPDIILADYALPSFFGVEALEIAQSKCPEIPFIFVSGTMGEETAVSVLKSGATDYLLKDRLFRLPAAVTRALEESQEKMRLKVIEEDRKKAVAALVEANHAKDEFIALLSHELRNPLASLLVNAEVMVEETKGKKNGKKYAEYAEAIHRQGNHMAKLLDDLLDVARVTRGDITLRKREVELKDAVKRAVEMIQPLADERGHTIALDIEPMRLLADPVRLEQIVMNIVSNAIKYTTAGGNIQITAHRENTGQNTEAVITVKDSGIGIAEEMLPKIFDIFARGNKTLAPTEGGLGVGLTLVKKLVELHGGRVRAESGGLGRGSEFTVTLPIAGGVEEESAQKTAVTSNASTILAHETGQKRVLVVDDNQDLTKTIGSALQKFGHSVSLAFSGKEALSRADEMRPEIVLLDIGLPVMDGLAVARTLREKFGGTMEIIALSGYGQEEDKVRAFQAGFDKYLVKPIGIKELQAAL